MAPLKLPIQVGDIQQASVNSKALGGQGDKCTTQNLRPPVSRTFLGAT